MDREFPAAIHFCLLAARDSLHAISGTPLGTFRHPPEKLLGQLCSDLAYTAVDEIITQGLHEYLDEFQTRLNRIGAGIFDTFFAMKTPAPARHFTRAQRNSPGPITALKNECRRLPTAVSSNPGGGPAAAAGDTRTLILEPCPFTSRSIIAASTATTGPWRSGRKSSGCAPRRTAGPAS